MALNVALPLSGLLPELLYERCALLSPIQQDFEDNLELLVTPYESSESGIGSNGSKNTKSSYEGDETSSPSSASSTSSPTPEKKSTEANPTVVDGIFDSKVKYQGRDVLYLAKNLTDSSWKFQYAKLPENNVQMFMQNRSQYHRLGADGLNCEYDLASCARCTFQFPIMSHDNAQSTLPSVKMCKHF